MEQTIDRHPLSASNAAKRRVRRRKTPLPASKATSQERFRSLLSNVPLILFTLDSVGIFTLSEGRGLQALGLQPEQLVGLSAFDVYGDFPETLDSIRRALAGETLTAIHQISNLIFEMQFTPLFDIAEKVTGVIVVVTDVKDRVQAEEALRASELRFRALSEQASDLVFILDAVGMYRYISPSHQRIMGYAPDELINSNIFGLIHPSDLSKAFTTFAGAFQSSKTMIRIECRMRHADGSWLTLECVGNNCFDDPTIEGLIVNARDITERTTMEERLRHQALHDTLTDLPNRTLLQERLEEALLSAKQMESKTSLLIMGLNRFKDVNDTFGHHYGDQLLQQVGTRLCQVVGSSDNVARLGGDEFAILLPTADAMDACRLAQQLLIALEEPFIVEEHSLQVEVSIGAVIYPEHGTDSLTLLRHADVAMHIAKQAREGYILYDATNDQHSARRLALIGALRRAIAAHELRLYYQPKAEVKTGKVHSVEALLRWQSPEYGFIPPDQFIPLAEQTGLITPLTQWVLEAAIQQCRAWIDAGLELRIAVNLSTWNLREATLPDTIAALLKHYAVPAHRLRLEVTESAVMLDMDRALAVLERLSALGLPISVDDFGTGYSSLAYLRRLPVDELKIDRAFVQHMTEVEADTAIVHTIITLAHSLHLEVVAEGVEDQNAWNLLNTLDCDTIQGYYVSRPLPAQDFKRWLLTRKEVV